MSLCTFVAAVCLWDGCSILLELALPYGHGLFELDLLHRKEVGSNE